jgi:hypothetical protein
MVGDDESDKVDREVSYGDLLGDWNIIYTMICSAGQLHFELWSGDFAYGQLLRSSQWRTMRGS